MSLFHCWKLFNFSLSLCIAFRVLNIFWLSIFLPWVYLLLLLRCVYQFGIGFLYDMIMWLNIKTRENFLWPTLSFFIMHSRKPLCWQWFDSVEKNWFYFSSALILKSSIVDNILLLFSWKEKFPSLKSSFYYKVDNPSGRVWKEVGNFCWIILKFLRASVDWLCLWEFDILVENKLKVKIYCLIYWIFYSIFKISTG